MTPPTIALAANNGDLGGGEEMLLNIASALRELGTDVLVLGPREPGMLLDTASRRGHRTVPLGASSRPGYMTALARWRRRHPWIPLWCNGLVPTLATVGMGPRIAHLHTLPAGRTAVAAGIGRIGARRVLVPSFHTASRVPGATVLPNWTAEIPFTPRRAPESGPLRVGFLGRMTRGKGVHVLGRAMEQVIRSSDREIRLVLAGENRFGDPADDRAISEAIAPISQSVDLLGWVVREEFFGQVDLAVFPSLDEETFGLVTAEAMAAGVPFVVSDAGALPEVAGPGHPWVAGGDAPALAAEIHSALDDVTTGRSAAAVTAARERWQRLYSPEAGTRRVAEVLCALSPQTPREAGRPR